MSAVLLAAVLQRTPPGNWKGKETRSINPDSEGESYRLPHLATVTLWCGELGPALGCGFSDKHGEAGARKAPPLALAMAALGKIKVEPPGIYRQQSALTPVHETYGSMVGVGQQETV